MTKKIWKTVFIGCSVTAAVLSVFVFLFLIIQMIRAPKLSEINAAPEGYLSTILDKDENVIETLYVTESNRIFVGLDHIPMNLQNAFIAIEDSRFYTHRGIDIQGIARAFTHGIKNGGFVQGASTITQQLLKNNVFTDWMSEETFYDRLCRKVQEQFLALRLEQTYSKEWILENYLNTINLGGGTRGVQVAAQYYFGKDVSELSLGECALIAGITRNPTAYNPVKNPEKSLERQVLVLNAMMDQGYIIQEQYDSAILEDVIGNLRVYAEDSDNRVFSWYEDALLRQIVQDLTATYRYNEDEAWQMVYSGGLTIYSAQDTALQKMCEEETTSAKWYTDDQEISLVITDVSTGAVRAIIGSSKPKDSSLAYNRATDAVRQPGSTIKIIGEYAAAVDMGMVTLGTVVDDEPYEYSNGTEIQNSYGNYKGKTTIRDAIASSSNVVALKTYQMTGERAVFEYLEKFGITTLTEEDRNEAVSIGGTYHGVTNLEMTAAYNAIANEGRYIRPYFYTKVVNRNGDIVLENESDYEQVLKKESAKLLTSAMMDVIAKGTGKDAAVKELSLAGKSGTTNDKKDLWFVGYSSEYTCGVWGGYDNNASQTESGYVKKIWQSVMSKAHEGTAHKELHDSENLVAAEICKKCGLLAVKGLCDHTVQGNMCQKEYFVSGTEPKISCNCHTKVKICKESGEKAGSFCPITMTETKVFLKNGTEGTDDALHVVPADITETCQIHKAFWDRWFDPEPQKEPDDSEQKEENWWGDLFQGWF